MFVYYFLSHCNKWYETTYWEWLLNSVWRAQPIHMQLSTKVAYMYIYKCLRSISKKDISIAQVIIIKSEVSPFPTSYSVTYCIYVPGKPGICFRYNCAVYDECKYSNAFCLADRTRLFVQYTISLSSLCKFIWRHWTYEMPVRYILLSVWLRLSIFSPLSIIQYVGLYIFTLPISLVMIGRIYILCLIIIVKSEVWIITHCLGLGHETMVFAVCLSIFLALRVPVALHHLDSGITVDI